MKHLWIIISIISLIIGIHKTWLHGLSNSYLFFIFAIIAFLMFLVRKKISQQDKLT